MSIPEIEIKVLRQGDEAILANIAADVFDKPIDRQLSKLFLSDPRHHLVAAIKEGIVVGFVSAVHYIHPYKPSELWINEAGIASTHQGRGLAKLLLQKMFKIGLELGCSEAWVLTYRSNAPAMRLYASVGGKEDANDVVMFNFDLNNRD